MSEYKNISLFPIRETGIYETHLTKNERIDRFIDYIIYSHSSFQTRKGINDCIAIIREFEKTLIMSSDDGIFLQLEIMGKKYNPTENTYKKFDYVHNICKRFKDRKTEILKDKYYLKFIKIQEKYIKNKEDIDEITESINTIKNDIRYLTNEDVIISKIIEIKNLNDKLDFFHKKDIDYHYKIINMIQTSPNYIDYINIKKLDFIWNAYNFNDIDQKTLCLNKENIDKLHTNGRFFESYIKMHITNIISERLCISKDILEVISNVDLIDNYTVLGEIDISVFNKITGELISIIEIKHNMYDTITGIYQLQKIKERIITKINCIKENNNNRLEFTFKNNDEEINKKIKNILHKIKNNNVMIKIAEILPNIEDLDELDNHIEKVTRELFGPDYTSSQSNTGYDSEHTNNETKIFKIKNINIPRNKFKNIKKYVVKKIKSMGLINITDKIMNGFTENTTFFVVTQDQYMNNNTYTSYAVNKIVFEYLLNDKIFSDIGNCSKINISENDREYLWNCMNEIIEKTPMVNSIENMTEQYKDNLIIVSNFK
jgi:hypothetical protein